MLDIVIEARKASIAPGMDVRRILPFRLRRMVGPFIFMDHAGPVDVQPTRISNMDVLPHPHIGLSTVSYLFGGQVTHRDSLGVEQIIRPGEVNWMTAGKGISHSERFEDPAVLSGGQLEMIQTWVALPEKDEESNPSFDNYKPEALPVFTDKGVWMRLIAGTAFGLANKVKTRSPLFYLHVVLEDGARLTLPEKHSERGIYVAKGGIDIFPFKIARLIAKHFGKGSVDRENDTAIVKYQYTRGNNISKVIHTTLLYSPDILSSPGSFPPDGSYVDNGLSP